MTDSKETDMDGLADDEVEVSVRDNLGEPQTARIVNDYVLICAGNHYLDHVQKHANGTVVLTVKVEDAR